MARIQFEVPKSGDEVLWREESKIDFRVMARAKCGGKKKLPKKQSIHSLAIQVVGGVIVWACAACTGAGSLAFIDNGPADEQ